MFNPTLGTRLIINGREYRFAPHPAAPSLVWGQEGRHAIVYRMQDHGEDYALKVFKPAFRHEGLLSTAQALWTYHELPGMRVCQQAIITAESFPDLVAEYEDLNYAMVMPWIEGKTWFDYLNHRQRLTLDQGRAVAESMAWVLHALELNSLAHCDLSSGNVIIDPRLDQIHLVDVEDLYSPWLTPPPMVPAGSSGYQHSQVVKTGQWGPLGDRFAGAILMAEMLSWPHPDVRKNAYGESYFAPSELQQPSERFDILCRALQVYDAGFAELFEETWWAQSLESCPPLKTWYDLLDALPRAPVAKWAPIDTRIFVEPAADPVRTASGAAPGLAAGRGPRSRLEGCLRAFVIAGVVGLACCVVTGLALEWSAIQDVLPCGTGAAALGLPLASIMWWANKHHELPRTF